MQHLRALAGQFQHFIISNLIQFSGIGHQTGIGGIHAVHIRIDLAQIRPECRRQRNGTGIGAAAAQRCNVTVAVHALKSGHDHDPMLVQLRLNPLTVDLFDAGVRVHGGGLDAHLPRRQRHAGKPHCLQRHGTQGYGNLFTGGQQHIHLPLGSVGIDLLRLGDQIVGGVALGGENHDHIVALQVGLGDDAGNVADMFGILDGAAAEFLYDQTHSIILLCLRLNCPPASSYAGILRLEPQSITRRQAYACTARESSSACCPLIRSVRKAACPSFSQRDSTVPSPASCREPLSTRK